MLRLTGTLAETIEADGDLVGALDLWSQVADTPRGKSEIQRLKMAQIAELENEKKWTEAEALLGDLDPEEDSTQATQAKLLLNWAKDSEPAQAQEILEKLQQSQPDLEALKTELSAVYAKRVEELKAAENTDEAKSVHEKWKALDPEAAGEFEEKEDPAETFRYHLLEKEFSAADTLLDQLTETEPEREDLPELKKTLVQGWSEHLNSEDRHEEAYELADRLEGADKAAIQWASLKPWLPKLEEEKQQQKALEMLDKVAAESSEADEIKSAAVEMMFRWGESLEGEASLAIMKQILERDAEHEGAKAAVAAAEKAAEPEPEPAAEAEAPPANQGMGLAAPVDAIDISGMSPEDASAMLREKLMADVHDVPAHKAVYELFGDSSAARKLIDFYRDIQKANSGDSAYLLHLARAYCHVGKDTLAVVQFRKLLQSDPQPPIYCDLGNAYSRLKKVQEATKAFDNALKIDPAYELAHLSKIRTYSKAGDVDDAVSAAGEALSHGLSPAAKEWVEKVKGVLDQGNAPRRGPFGRSPDLTGPTIRKRRAGNSCLETPCPGLSSLEPRPRRDLHPWARTYSD